MENNCKSFVDYDFNIINFKFRLKSVFLVALITSRIVLTTEFFDVTM